MNDILKAVDILSKRSSGSKAVTGLVVSVGPNIARVKIGSSVVTAKTQPHARVQVGDTCVVERSSTGKSWIVQSVYSESNFGKDQQSASNSSGIVNNAANIAGSSVVAFNLGSNFQVWTGLEPSILIKTTRPTVLIIANIRPYVAPGTVGQSGDMLFRVMMDEQLEGITTPTIYLPLGASAFSAHIPYIFAFTNVSPGYHGFTIEGYLSAAGATFNTNCSLITATAVEI